MSQRKPNRKTWYSLALSVVLCVAGLVIATGTTYARYQAEQLLGTDIRVRAADQVHLGQVTMVPAEVETEGEAQPAEPEEPVMEAIFDAQAQLAWKTEKEVDSEGNEKMVTSLKFSIANGTAKDDYSGRDQVARLKMVGTLGLWDGTGTPELLVYYRANPEDEQDTVAAAVTEPIPRGSALWYTYGDGWIYTFLDENGEELLWELPGGKLSFVTMTVVINEEVPDRVNLLQPFVAAEPKQEIH